MAVVPLDVHSGTGGDVDFDGLGINHGHIDSIQSLICTAPKQDCPLTRWQYAIPVPKEERGQPKLNLEDNGNI